ncbi:MAG: ABC transporter permease, partial [Actinobacteria bacterium]|nr:ABC transporter permease [Actinomycetota bacterium]
MTARASHQPPGGYRFRHLARMEWIKLRSLRSTWLTLALAVCAPAGIALATGNGNTTSGGMFVSNTLVGMLIGVLLTGVAGVLAMTSEYTSGTIGATFAAAPRRLGVLAAKAAVVGTVALVTGEAAAFLSFFAGCMTLRYGITAPALGQPGVLRAI